jgi:zinc transport system substrate-binding protein
MKKGFLALLMTLFMVFPAAHAEEAKPKVVATIFPAYDFARTVAGEDAEVTMLLKPGAESHDYEPSPADIIAIQDCDVFFYIGGESDKWVDDILSSIDLTGKQVVKLIDSVDAIEEEVPEGMQADEEEEEEGVAYDEHIWTSPVNASKMAEAEADALIAIDPANEEGYQARLAAYQAQLSELDQQFRDVVANGVRKEVLFGDRFPLVYFTKEYGLTYYAAFPGCANESEPTVQTVAFLIDRLNEDKLPVVFHIEMGNTRVAESIAQETGAQVLLFDSCHNVTKEELEAGATYLSLMQGNVEALRIALN